MFKVNEGNIDRIIRAILGAGLIIGGFVATGTIAIVLWIAGAVLAGTAATGICLLYIPLGINTCSTKK
ncbi:MAG TPA: DUF2892 domain-containing protein [Leptospiraceae bacterium]|nr:DUF2892 domain-containing protein [Leptospiraceae bacterium]HMW04708.1 DUF2892 domain-containing protein [Leptospiraceae bacterium]HMX31739.1 DUF2892 domain-containing protein [Leptospiraceae bacterium]HMY30545.1 DUF2892 domain-containing protein [Leptospiraceae bacterium]HMZ64154.1 DUF2892 domain-containing protein [Leptospiraceae bacterium]